jgi:carbon-monoxide dehydrogenase medium subunit
MDEAPAAVGITLLFPYTSGLAFVDRLLAEGGWDAKPLAGGQSLVPLLNLRFARPSLLVDLNRLPGLDRVDAANGSVRVGALVRQNALERSPLIRDRCPLILECLPFIGHFVTRNRGTVGGSMAHGDAAAELPLALVTLGGSIVVQSVQDRREIPAEAFFVGHFTTALEPGELVVETLWPGAADGWGYAFEELAQRHGDYGLSLAACALRIEAGKVAEARICLGAVTARPTLVEAPLPGRLVDAGAAREAAEAARASIEPSPTVHASSDYQRHLTGVLVERAVLRAWRNATGGDA